MSDEPAPRVQNNNEPMDARMKRLQLSANAPAFVPGQPRPQQSSPQPPPPPQPQQAQPPQPPPSQPQEDEEDTPDPTKLRGELNQENLRIEVVQAQGANDPLVSAKTFEELGLRETLLQGIYALKYKAPSLIQEVSLPIILRDPPRNFIGQAQSGTGKTACFVLGMLSRINETIPEPQALCICPTRELARQIYTVIQEMGKFTQAKIQLWTRGTESSSATGGGGGGRDGRITAQIIVGTPGRVWDSIQRRVISTRSIRLFVLDEADVMLDQQGLGDQSIRIRQQLPPNCQILLFSATFKDRVKQFAERVVPNAFIIHVKRELLALKFIKQLYVRVSSEQAKFKILEDIYSMLDVGQSIIFVETRNNAKLLTERMRQGGHSVSVLHGGDMDPAKRDEILDAFRKGLTKVLITTNVLARGIDVPQVNLVINYDMPTEQDTSVDPETYIHRIGRAGRFGRPGVSLNIIHNEASFDNQRYIQKYFNVEITEIPADDLERVERIIKNPQQA